MSRLTQLLKNLFAQSSPRSPSTTGAEMTLHDVLRICAARVPQRPGPVVPATGYQLVANDCLEMSSKPVCNLRSHSFGGRLSAYGIDKHEPRFASTKWQAR
jgi:hypothetical protein